MELFEQKRSAAGFSVWRFFFCYSRYPAKLGVQIAGTMFQTHAMLF
ncbi:MAG: DUF6783 domain-containing protein [Fusicatenibacter saccharivorans]